MLLIYNFIQLSLIKFKNIKILINCIESCELNEWTERGNIMEGKTSSKNILKFAGAYVACAIGSGFAMARKSCSFLQHMEHLVLQEVS